MLIIGHRGSRGTHPENTVESLNEAMSAGADLLEFDIRVTKDNQPILSHDQHMFHTHHRFDYFRRHSLDELETIVKKNDSAPITTLDEALKLAFGKVLIVIDLKEAQSIDPVLELLKNYIKHDNDWDNVLFSAFSPLLLRKIRRRAPLASLAMLHHRNPLNFLVWYRTLDLTAVGFHRLYLSSFGLSVAKELGLFTYVYTVNRSEAARQLSARGIDGIVTDYPAKMIEKLN